jgi:hypothetical protein
MFEFLSLLRNKETLNAISDETYASNVRKMILEAEPGGRAMTVIAYKNLWMPVLSSMKHQSEGKFPDFSLENLIAWQIEDAQRAAHQNDKVNAIRFIWFATAACVMRMDWTIVNRHREFEEVGAEIWLALASSGAHIGPLTKDSAIWTPEEKARYSGLSTARDGICYVLNFVMPDRYLRMSQFQSLFDQNDLFINDHAGLEGRRPYVYKMPTAEERAEILREAERLIAQRGTSPSRKGPTS